MVTIIEEFWIGFNVKAVNHSFDSVRELILSMIKFMIGNMWVSLLNGLAFNVSVEQKEISLTIRLDYYVSCL